MSLPFDKLFFIGNSRQDILTGRLLEYCDFLLANTPWFNWTKCNELDSIAGINCAHKRFSAMVELQEKLREWYCLKSVPASASIQGRLKCRRLRLDNINLGEAVKWMAAMCDCLPCLSWLCFE